MCYFWPFDMRVNNQAQVSGFDSLSRRSSPNASYNALGQLYDQPKCHPDTRVSVLGKIKCWTQGFNGGIDPTRRIMWLRGAAGAGKTAIAHDIAEWCGAEKQGLLLATFFFWRTDSTRNEIKPFIPTLAYAITQSVPAARSLIVNAVESDPHIFSRSLEIQLLKLVLEPLIHLSEIPTSSDLPHVIIVDGLDECVQAKEQKALLNLFVHAFTHHKPRWRVLITSRPEQAIASSFDAATLQDISTVLDLDREYNSHGDIRRFLVDNFKEIKETHPRKRFIPSGWPNSDSVNKLVGNASGQFIYAATVINYVKSDYDSPVNRLKSILDTSPQDYQGRRQEMPFAELDYLYSHILSSTRVADVKTACHVVACCVVLVPTLYSTSWVNPYRYSNPTQTVADILSMEIETLCAILEELRSIVHFTHEATRFNFKLLHASFEDFIFDPRRSGDLYIDRTMLHASIACSYLRLLHKHPLVHLEDLCRTLWFHASSFTVTSITPELAKCLSRANFIPILDKIRNNHLYYAPYFPPILAALKDRSQDFENGVEIYQEHVSAFDEWCACQLEDYLQQSSALKSLVAFFPFVYEHDVKHHRDDIRYDFDHLQLLGKPGNDTLKTNWDLLPLSDLPRTRLVVQNGEANATAALSVIQNIDSYTWPTYAEENPSRKVPKRVCDSLTRLPMLLKQAAYSSDLINALPSNSVKFFSDDTTKLFDESWHAVKVAIKIYFNRHGVAPVKSNFPFPSGNIMSDTADCDMTWSKFVAILDECAPDSDDDSFKLEQVYVSGSEDDLLEHNSE